jgi:trimeric autotransporter adhesin
MTSHRTKLGFITALVIVSLLLVNLPAMAWSGTAIAAVPHSSQTSTAKQPESPTAVATVGTGGTYLTLKAAFDDINSGVLTGTVQLDVIGDTTETAAAVLNASGSGSASYTSVLIQPSGGAWTISGAIVAGSPLIDLNGADNVTIDGLNTGGNALTIANTTVSATSGTSTIRLIGGATNNTITNATIQGSFSASVATNGGNIFLSTDANTPNGNDNNTISNNNIGPAGSNLPTKGVYSNGSTTTTAINNSGNVITGNNIYDYFGAAVTSAGVYIAGGSTDFTISSNKFYQTATRTQTTGAQHSAIWIANTTSGNNFQITGNTVGYSSAVGTGTYNFVGVSTSSKLIAIYLNIASTTASSVQGNTVTAINISGVTGGTGTTAAFVGISVNGGLVTIGNVTGNTIGSLAAADAISLTNNTTAAFEVYGVYYFPSLAANISNNAVGGLGLTNSGTAALTFYGLRAFTSSSIANVFANNTVGSAAAPIVNTSSSTSSRAIGIYSQSGITTMTGNTVRYLTMNGGNVGTGSSASVIGLWVDAASASGHTISRNTVYALSNTNATAAVWVTGLQFNGTTGTNVVARNSIYNLSTPSTSATATINGINVQGGTTTYQNNMVVLGNDLTANSPQINGINEAVAGTDNFYFNSVYVGGAGVVAGTANSFAFFSSITVNTRNYRDNIFFNARSNSTAIGKHYAIRVGGTTPNPAGLTSNSNVITTTGTGGYVGLFNAVDQATLANWRTATGQDAASFDLDPQFIAPAAATPDLHISSVITTVVEGNGFPIAAVTDDFDGETRASLTPTDIGADAGNFIGLDLTGPVITYTPFGNTSLMTDRLLAATIADVTGVPTSGSLQPRLYYNKNGGTWYSAQGALVTGTGLNGTWNFTVTVSDFGGVTAGDVISYFVIAQDTASPINLSSNPAGAVASDVNTITTPPTPNTYTVLPSISGTKYVGTVNDAGCPSLDYATITATVGALNAAVLTGPATFVLCDSAYAGETFPITINANAGSSATNTATFKPAAGLQVAVSGSSATALIVLNGADNMVLDGSNSGGTTRDLTITNTNTGTSSAVIWGQTTAGLDAATSNTVKNLNVVGSGNTQTLIAIGFGGTAISASSLGTGNNNNTIQNNNVSKTQYGIYSQGASAANKNQGNIITQNLINTASPNNVSKVGIQVGFENNLQITDNTISGMAQTSSPDVFAIGVGIASISTSTYTGNEVTNATIARNTIGSTRNTGTFSACGICVAPATSGTNVIVNNMIWGVSANGTSGDFSVGILIGGGAGSTTQVYFNSVSMNGTQTGGSDKSYALAIGGSDPVVDVRNNALHNTQNNGTGNNYAIGLNSGTFVNLTSNYNDFYVTTDATHFVGGTGSLASPTNQATLTSLQTATGQDANSLAVDPLFVSVTDLHLTAASPAIWAGTPIGGITTDIDGDTRCVAAPSIGADEGQRVPAVTFTVNPASPLSGQPVDFAATVLTGTAPFTYTWDFGDGTPVGNGNPVSHTYTIAGTYTATLTVDCKCGSAIASQPVSVSDAPMPPTLGVLQSSAPTALGNATYFTGTLVAGSTPITYTWDFGDGTVVEDGLNINHTFSPVGLYTVTLTAVNVAGTDVATSTVRVGLPPTALFDVTPNPTYYPEATAFTFTGDPGTGPTTYLWTLSNGLTNTVEFFTATLAAPVEINNYTSTLRVSNPYGVAITDTVVTVLNTSADLGIAKTAAPDPVEGGAPLTYTLAISNFGPNALIGAPIGSFSFTNTAYITIPSSGAATPYPSAIDVSGITDPVGQVKATLYGITHTFPDDIEVLLVGPAGQKVVLMANAGGSNALTGVNLTFDDNAASSLPDSTQITSGTYKPTWYGTVSFPAPAPAAPYSSLLSVFAGADPNGAWNLYVVDDAAGDSGAFTGGWSLEFTTVAPLTTTIVDTLPSGYTFGSASGSGWTCGNNVGTVTCTRGSLPVGAAPNIVIAGNAPLLRDSGEITNTATVASVLPDYNLINNTTMITTLVNALPAQLTVNTVGNGTVDQNPQPPYVVGDVVTLTANAATGWSFAGWSGDLTGMTNPAAITLTGNKVVTATFTHDPVSLIVSVVGSGAVDQTPQPPYGVGDVVTLTATPDANWSFAGWSGDLSGVTSPITITLDSDKVVTATFILNQANLTVNVVGNGTVSQIPMPPYVVGDVVTLTATPDADWSFAGWSGDLSGTTNPITITLDSDKVVTATFILNQANLTVNVVGNGTVSQIPVPPYGVGDVVTLTATPDANWSFAGWSGDLSGTTSPITITLDSDKVVTATFAINTYTITPIAGANGSIMPDTPQTVDYGASQMFTIAADTGYHISDVGVDGVSIGAESAYTFTNVIVDHTITATFAANSVNLTVNVVEGGTVSKDPDQAYLYGDVVTLTATANPNWAFAGWSGDLSGTTNPITITLTGDKVVTATFASTCVPVSGVDFTYLPTAPKVNKLVTFTGSAVTGTTPITYSWDFGDGSAVGSGSPITHLFPIMLTTHSYTVTLTAANVCSTQATASKLVTIQPVRVYLPLILK